MSKPIVVLISDIHFNIQTIRLAEAALLQAVHLANKLNIRLLIAGDLHDQKANIRGECIKSIMDVLEQANIEPICIVANHDRINEKSSEHSLEFLRNTVQLVTKPVYKDPYGYILPYFHDPEALKAYLKTVPKGTRLIMHQGCSDSNSGEYIQDKSALPKECFADFRVISGHYHTRQDIKTGRPQKGAVGLFSYIGNPYTLNFAEANDPSKGFQILMDDGTLEFVPTNLRRHIVINVKVEELTSNIKVTINYAPNDLIWVKVSGTKEELLNLTRQAVATKMGLKIDFKLDFIPTDTNIANIVPQNQTQEQALDTLIDSLTETSDDRKERLKELWRNVICG